MGTHDGVVAIYDIRKAGDKVFNIYYIKKLQ